MMKVFGNYNFLIIKKLANHENFLNYQNVSNKNYNLLEANS